MRSFQPPAFHASRKLGLPRALAMFVVSAFMAAAATEPLLLLLLLPLSCYRLLASASCCYGTGSFEQVRCCPCVRALL